MKPVVLTFTRHFLPGFKSGGPIRTIANMVDQLGDDIDFRIVTSDRDAKDDTAFRDVKVDKWNQLNKAEVYYCSSRSTSIGAFGRLMRETPHDIIYLNSFFDPLFTLRPLLAQRLMRASASSVIIAPRGEFSANAYTLKRWKKLPYTLLGKSVCLFNNVTWQASSEFEAEDIRRVMGVDKVKVCIAPNMPPSQESFTEDGDKARLTKKDALQILFLSRIDVMKNLDLALQTLAQVSVPVIFNIYGPIWNESYWQQCKKLIAALPGHVTANYCGTVPPQEVGRIMKRHDLFFLPTRGENFGHVILEALMVGTPVLISNKTPWQDDGVGGCKVCALDAPDDFVHAVENFSKLEPAARLTARQAAKAKAESFMDREQLIDKNLNLFNTALALQRMKCAF